MMLSERKKFKAKKLIFARNTSSHQRKNELGEFSSLAPMISKIYESDGNPLMSILYSYWIRKPEVTLDRIAWDNIFYRELTLKQKIFSIHIFAIFNTEIILRVKN
jgi:hypothetical protein